MRIPRVLISSHGGGYAGSSNGRILLGLAGFLASLAIIAAVIQLCAKHKKKKAVKEGIETIASKRDENTKAEKKSYVNSSSYNGDMITAGVIWSTASSGGHGHHGGGHGHHGGRGGHHGGGHGYHGGGHGHHGGGCGHHGGGGGHHGGGGGGGVC